MEVAGPQLAAYGVRPRAWPAGLEGGPREALVEGSWKSPGRRGCCHGADPADGDSKLWQQHP